MRRRGFECSLRRNPGRERGGYAPGSRQFPVVAQASREFGAGGQAGHASQLRLVDDVGDERREWCLAEERTPGWGVGGGGRMSVKSER